MDLRLLNPIDRLIVADAPGWRSDRGSELDAPPIQQLFAERTGADAATTSQYVATIVPYAGDKSPVESARLLAHEPDVGLVAVEVQLAERIDIIVSSQDTETRQIGSLSVAGRFAFVSCDLNGKVEKAYLLGGTALQVGDACLAQHAAMSHLEVASTANCTYNLRHDLPTELVRPGQYLLAAGTGYEIESTGPRSITVRDYPVTMCDAIQVLHDATWIRSQPVAFESRPE
jgi:hypothetical protein